MAHSSIEQVLRILGDEQDLDHRPVLAGVNEVEDLMELIARLRRFLREDPSTSGNRRVFLLQERAILVMGDVLWKLQQRGRLPRRPDLEDILLDVSATPRTRAEMLKVLLEPPAAKEPDENAYLAFINQFLAAVNEREIRDFSQSKEELLSRVTERGRPLSLKSRQVSYHARVPMRVGISSANASDNWTFSKLRGGKVVNFAVDLAAAAGADPQPPIEVTLELLSENVIELATMSHLDTDRATQAVFKAANAAEFLSVPPGSEPTAERCFKDVKDPLILLKYALVFSGVVPFRSHPEAYLAQPARVLEDVARVAGGGLRLMVRSSGPSRAGFASSSCVALALLRVLYGATNQEELATAHNLSSMALLLENEVGLKSGKQDTDGPLHPGVKSIRYLPTVGFLESEIHRIVLDEAALRENLWLVNSGIQRPAATGLRRGLNMRHYSYISRDPRRFPAVLRSLVVHDEIVTALRASDWAHLGRLFDRYLDLRETIDPGSTQSEYDEAAGLKVLRLPFERLRQAGLIHGGMYTGAMGGGCLMLIATPRGREKVVDDATHQETTRLARELEGLKDYAAGQQRPFQGLQLYHYAVNKKGLEYWEKSLR